MYGEISGGGGGIYLQGALVILSPPYWAYNEAYIEVTETCNTSYERKFCGLLDFV